METLRLFFEDKRIWVTLGGNVFGAFLLALIIIPLDMRLIPAIDLLPDIMLTSVNLAKDILGLLAGSLFSVTTFTFGTMLTVISFYSSNFSPRTVENFLMHKTSMKTLGVFLGGFIYCLASLFFMRNSENEYLVVAATIALMYAFFCVYYFVRFVYYVANFVRLEKLVDRLYDEADAIFDSSIAFFADQPTWDHLPQFHTLHQYTVKAAKNGYVEYVNFKNLVKLAAEKEGIFIMDLRLGEFADINKPLATFYTNHPMSEDDDLNGAFNAALVYEKNRSTMYDPNFARTKLIEVALRAVSPGINDPNTAIHILHYKGLLDAKLAALPGRYVQLGVPEPAEEAEGNEENEEDEENGAVMENQGTEEKEAPSHLGTVFYDFNNFPEDLYQSYWQLIHYMKEDISGVTALFDSLLTVAHAAHPKKLSYVQTYSKHVYDLTITYFDQEFDRQMLDKRHQEILAISKKEETAKS